MPSPLGHALAGVAVAWTADLVPGTRAAMPMRDDSSFKLAGGSLVLICVALAALPDIDLLFHAHRTMTHSVTAAVLVTIVAGAVTRWVTPDRMWRIALTCGAAYATHLLLDWLAVDNFDPRGLQLFWPFGSSFYLSGLDLFPRTERSPLFALRTIRTDLNAAFWETVLLLPPTLLVGFVRIKALARLAPEMARRDEAPQ